MLTCFLIQAHCLCIWIIWETGILLESELRRTFSGADSISKNTLFFMH